MSDRTPSRRTPRGRFRNPIPERMPPFRQMIRDWVRANAQTTPNGSLPVERRSMHGFIDEPRSGLRITWLGHSTSLVEIDGQRFLIDPVWAERPSPSRRIGPKRFFEPPLPLAELPPIDGVLISHDHYDHLDRDTVVHLALMGRPFVTPLGVGAHLTKWGIPEDQIVELDWWDDVEIGGITITATPSRHFSGRSPFMTDRNKTLWSGFALVGPEHRVYYAGDTAMFDGFDEIGRELGPFDATLIEVGAYNRLWADVHLGPEQAVEAFQRARGGLMIPIHWATFDLAMHGWTEPIERVLVEAEKAGIELSVPWPGQSIEPASPPPVIRWWPEVPWQTADEHPVVSSGLNGRRPLPFESTQPLAAVASHI